MPEITKEQKEKILKRLFWDIDIDPDTLDLLNKDSGDLEDYREVNFYRRLLMSCDWYTLLKLIPSKKLKILLSDEVIKGIFPKDLKDNYLYAQRFLSK